MRSPLVTKATMRLNKYIAACGVSSRRKADALIQEGKVVVNGQPATDFSYRVASGDVVEVNGQQISLPEQRTVMVMYKPVGVTTTMNDPHAERVVAELLPQEYKHLHPVGRLDRESEGLLIFTNDGDLTQQLMHPSFEHEKEYEVTTEEKLTDQQLQRLRAGFEMEEGHTGPNPVERTGANRFRITLKQGWKRQIRRMVKHVRGEVTRLQRIRVQRLTLGQKPIEQLAPGEWKIIAREDILE